MATASQRAAYSARVVHGVDLSKVYQDVAASSVPDVAVASVGNGVANNVYTGYLKYDFTNTGVWASGALQNQLDQYDYDLTTTGNPAYAALRLATNDGAQMLDHHQTHADGGNQYYYVCSSGTPVANLIGLNVSFRFRALIDSDSNDSGHSIRYLVSDAVSGDYIIWKILGNGVIQTQVNTNTRINQAGLTPGNITVMGYYDATATYFYMKAKDGHDAAMSWTTWDGSDADAFGSYDEEQTFTNAKLAFGMGTDTVPVTHGFTKSFEFMTSNFAGWA